MAGKFELKKGGSGQFRFNFKAGNGEPILTSESYRTKASAQGGIESVKKHAAADANYERKASAQGQPYFVLKAANGETIGTSEMYSSTSARESGITAVKASAPGATVVDLTG
ncbi:hypothetical protein TFLX_06715 [Thermoflexales bacterium]|nr:hypothetical protein TFLX_06715 [Thermoflexales bacterium]